MSERWDYIAVGPHGVYGLCEDTPGDPGKVARDFVRRVEARGHRVERVPVAEAVERHKAFLALARATQTNTGE